MWFDLSKRKGTGNTFYVMAQLNGPEATWMEICKTKHPGFAQNIAASFDKTWKESCLIEIHNANHPDKKGW